MRKLFFNLILLFCATVLEWIKLKDDPNKFYLETDQSENGFCRLREIPEKIGFFMLTLGGVIFVAFFVKKYFKVNGDFFWWKFCIFLPRKFSKNHENGKRLNSATRGEEIRKIRKNYDFGLLPNLVKNQIYMKSMKFVFLTSQNGAKFRGKYLIFHKK